MRDLPVSAWILIACFLSFFVVLNLSLFYALRHKSPSSLPGVATKPGDFLRNPWKKEDQQWQELSDRVDELAYQDKEEHPRSKSS